MQLGDAVEGWLVAHDHALSPSTRQDIEEIGVAVVVCGHDGVPCAALTASERSEIVAEAEGRTSLSSAAIREFLGIVVEWGREQSRNAPTSRTTDELAPAWSVQDANAGRRDAPVADNRPVVDDLDLDENWADELPAIVDPEPFDRPGAADDAPEPFNAYDAADDAAEAGAEPEPFDRPDAFRPDAADDAAEAGAEPEPDDDLIVTEGVALDEAEAVDEEDLDVDELAMIDDDLTVTDEHELGLEELEIIDADLAELESDPTPALVTSDATPSTPPIAGDPAASSFLQTIGRSAAPASAFADLSRRADEPIPITVPSREDPRMFSESGIFSEAAHRDDQRRSIDWLTVTYFVVAAICFGFVIYFYLSS